MERYRSGRRPEYGGRRRYWPRSRAGGCLLWIVLLIVLLIVLSVLFGGFQKGTQVKSLGGASASHQAVTLLAPCAVPPLGVGSPGLAVGKT